MRIVQIGFNRAGTSSLSDFLARAGFTCVDHHFEDGAFAGQNVADLVEANIASKRKPLAGLEAWSAFTDMETVSEQAAIYVQKRFREIAEAHPEVKFILNIRRKQDWLQSRAKFGGYLATCAAAAKVSEAEMISMWELEWDSHIEAVRTYFRNDRLLVLDIDNLDESKLCRFVGLERTIKFEQKNKAARGPVSKLLQNLSDPSVAALFPQAFKNWIKNY